MRFWVLGSGTTLPSGDRGPAGFLVDHQGTQILIDGGSGTLDRLHRAGFSPNDLDGGLYSHLHLDHCGDLAPLLFTLKVQRRARDYPLWGGEGLGSHLAGIRAVYGTGVRGAGWRVPVTELPLNAAGSELLPGNLRLDTRPAQHGAGALHLKVTSASGRAVVFSGDTGVSPELAELAKGVDLLVCECALAAPLEGVDHLWPEAVAAVVAAARPRRVVLTHLYPEVDEARALAVVGAVGVPVEHARDVQAFDL